MVFHSLDWFLLALYFALSLGLGLFLGRRGGSSLSEYFVSGRRLPWLLVGTGMVATTFAADTPLWVAGKVSEYGVSGNWLWWSAAAGGALTVFFFARLWRRSGVLTDLEFIELRYSGRMAAFLRGFKALYFGLFMNCIVLGWVNEALGKIFGVLLPEFNPQLLVALTAGLTLAYVTFSGLRGVMVADAFQFVTALGGCILLAIFAVQHPVVQAQGGLTGALPESFFAFFPDFDAQSGAGGVDVARAGQETINPAGQSLSEGQAGGLADSLQRIALSAFLAYILIQWWASWYPGAEPGGGGYVAQRIFSARDEREGMLATLWFLVAHYCVRSWPWIIAALAAIVIYPELSAGDERERTFVMLIGDVLPIGLRGLLAAAFIGAYMSTFSTHLNWGASYAVNDFYRRFLRPEAGEAHYIFIGRLATIALAALSLALSFGFLDSIREAWDFLLSITAGMGFVLIARWYWHRMNATAELVSMLAPLAAILGLELAPLVIPGFVPPGAPENLYVIAPLSLALTLIAMYATQPESSETLRRFYERVRPPGPGWKPVAQDLERTLQAEGRTLSSVGGSGRVGPLFLGWLAAIALIYGALFASGAAIFARWGEALGFGALALAGAAAVFYVIQKEFQGTGGRPENQAEGQQNDQEGEA